MPDERSVVNPVYDGEIEGGIVSSGISPLGSTQPAAASSPTSSVTSSTSSSMKVVVGIMGLTIVGLVVALALIASGTEVAPACSCAEDNGLLSASTGEGNEDDCEAELEALRESCDVSSPEETAAPTIPPLTTTTVSTTTSSATTTTTTTVSTTSVTTTVSTTTTTTTTSVTATTTTVPLRWGNSSILTGEDGTKAENFLPNQIEDVLGSRYAADGTTWELLWKGARDGYSASEFHAACDGNFATIHVVKSASGYVFGAVQGIGFDGSNGWVTTDKAFVYGIRTHGSPNVPVVFLPTKNLQWAFEQRPDRLGQWGGGAAFTIGHSNPGATYTGNGITVHDTDAGHEYLAGSWHFQVAELEVFKIVMPTVPPMWDASLILEASVDDGNRAGRYLPHWIEQHLDSKFAADETTWKLLYRGTRDGFSASNFHAICDGDFATIHVVKSASGYVFGAVQGIGFDGNIGNQYVTTDKAFVYGIRTHGSPNVPVIFLPTKNLQWAIEQQPNSLGAAWGGGHALKITDNANLYSEWPDASHSNLGATYTGNGITVHDTDAGHEYLAGSWHFQVAELEVFKIVGPKYSADLTSGVAAAQLQRDTRVAASQAGTLEMAIDDNANSEWSEGTAATAAGAWFAIEFGTAVEIRRVTVQTGSGNNACVNIDVEYYDGSAWVVAQNIRPGADNAVHAFAVAASSSHTQWRLVCKVTIGAPYSWTIREVEMMEIVR